MVVLAQVRVCGEGRAGKGEGLVNEPTGLSFRVCSTCTFQFI